jgi:hypothetical protein
VPTKTLATPEVPRRMTAAGALGGSSRVYSPLAALSHVTDFFDSTILPFRSCSFTAFKIQKYGKKRRKL